MDRALVNYLDPGAHEFSKELLPRIVDSYLRVIHLMLQSSPLPDFVILTRFDLDYHQPVPELNYHPDKVNIAFRDLQDKWEKDQWVSDLFFLMPGRFLELFGKSLEESCASEAALTYRPPVEHSVVVATRGRGAVCPGHFVYQPLVTNIGSDNIRMIDDAFRSSRSATGTFISINRACGGWSSHEHGYSCRVPALNPLLNSSKVADLTKRRREHDRLRDEMIANGTLQPRCPPRFPRCQKSVIGEKSSQLAAGT
jgi:hypothetical protein